MYISKDASRRRRVEARDARRNRTEIVSALSTGQVTRRDLFRWGVFTTTGALAWKNGLSPFAQSAYASVPTGSPLSPLFGVKPFSQPLPRLNLQTPEPLTPVRRGSELDLLWPAHTGEVPSRRLSYHTDFTASGGASHRNPKYPAGPMEGRPPGEYFAHQRWEEYLPQVGYSMTLAPLQSGIGFHPDLPEQAADKVWSFGRKKATQSVLPPPLIKARYGEPVIFRHHNGLPRDYHENGGFGSISQSTHNHNAHNASASDGACNAHFFPGQFYDYHWSTTLARSDMKNRSATDPLASGPDGNGGLIQVPGDYRELQGTLWFHDHRFFYTAENVYKGHAGMLNYYSGKDRGHEGLDDGVNLRLPSGTELDWGNIDFDVNLMIHDVAWDEDGQLLFDIFDTDGFVGDIMCVNYAYKPYFEVLPRKYRFRILNASIARFVQLGLIDELRKWVPVTVVSADGNLLQAPVKVNYLDPQGPAERFDIVVDFSGFAIGETVHMINSVEHRDGRGPKEYLSKSEAIRNDTDDPAVGRIMEFRVVSEVESVDAPGKLHRAGDTDRSRVPGELTRRIPVEAPVRTRVLEFKRTSDGEPGLTGACVPDCEDREFFPWTVRINGESQHFLNANRSSMVVPEPGQVEHWVLVNGGGGWDHPVHLHFEEGVTIDRGGDRMSALERRARKDVWRLGENGEVRMQVRFGEFGGAYVTHCHNAVHEDWAMLMRFDLQTDPKNPKNSQYHTSIVPTPNSTPEGVYFTTPEVLPEGNPFDKNFKPFPKS